MSRCLESHPDSLRQQRSIPDSRVFSARIRLSLSWSMGSLGGGLEEALILLYLLVDDAYRRVTFGGRLRHRGPDPKLSRS